MRRRLRLAACAASAVLLAGCGTERQDSTRGLLTRAELIRQLTLQDYTLDEKDPEYGDLHWLVMFSNSGSFTARAYYANGSAVTLKDSGNFDADMVRLGVFELESGNRLTLCEYYRRDSTVPAGEQREQLSYYRMQDDNSLICSDGSVLRQGTPWDGCAGYAYTKPTVIAEQSRQESWDFSALRGAKFAKVNTGKDGSLAMTGATSGKQPGDLQIMYRDIRLEEGRKYRLRLEYRIWVYPVGINGKRLKTAAKDYDPAAYLQSFTLENADGNPYLTHAALPVLDGSWRSAECSFVMTKHTDDHARFCLNAGALGLDGTRGLYAEIGIRGFVLERMDE